MLFIVKIRLYLTEFKKMNTEINLKIALAKFPELKEKYTAHYFATYFIENNRSSHDYVNDPALNRELEGELLQHSYYPRSSCGCNYWYERETEKDIWDKWQLPNNIINFGLATALAWLKMKGVE